MCAAKCMARQVHVHGKVSYSRCSYQVPGRAGTWRSPGVRCRGRNTSHCYGPPRPSPQMRPRQAILEKGRVMEGTNARMEASKLSRVQLHLQAGLVRCTNRQFECGPMWIPSNTIRDSMFSAGAVDAQACLFTTLQQPRALPTWSKSPLTNTWHFPLMHPMELTSASSSCKENKKSISCETGVDSMGTLTSTSSRSRPGTPLRLGSRFVRRSNQRTCTVGKGRGQERHPQQKTKLPTKPQQYPLQCIVDPVLLEEKRSTR